MIYVGCHLSSTGGNVAMVETARKIGANTFAFFTRNPRGSRAKPEDPADCAAAVERLKEYGFGKLVAHGAYTMNLCTAAPDGRKFACDVLCDDLRPDMVRGCTAIILAGTEKAAKSLCATS